MGRVALSILEPQNGQRFSGNAQAANVRLRGGVPTTGHGPLFYRWYSGIDGELNDASATAVEIQKPLTVGSHVLTFTAKDVQGESPAAIKTVKDAGVAGGPPEPGVDSPCVVHVFIATESATSSTLSKAGATLTAVAPKQWGKPIDFKDLTKGYVLNTDYHGDAAAKKVRINKIRYRWRFQPSGLPEGRLGGDLVPTVDKLAFLKDPDGGSRMVVRYSGPLPASLSTGSHTLTLRVEELVENQSGPTFGDETAPRDVMLT